MVNIGCAEGKGKANNKEKSQVNECLVATIGCHKWPLPTKNNKKKGKYGTLSARHRLFSFYLMTFP